MVELCNLSFEVLSVFLGGHLVETWSENQLAFEFIHFFSGLLLDSGVLFPLPLPVDFIQVSQEVVDKIKCQLVSVLDAEIVRQVVGIIRDPVFVVGVKTILTINVRFFLHL